MSNPSNYFVHRLLRARDWQHRPQFDRVCDWWRGGGRGVCALVGMGGAGKTAIAERFLNALPNVMPTATRIDPPLPQPHGVFVYSFYDDDKPENFFRNLQMWLEDSPRAETVLAVGPLMFLLQQRQGLIILDGLEKVQDSGARGGFGRLTSSSLRDLLDQIAHGAAPELSVLVTSRFPLADLRDSQPRFFQRIAVDQIEVAAGVGLLRDRGVRGSDLQLAPIVEHCGRHALTVDLAGGYIKEYGHGDPTTPLNLGTAEELQAEAEDEPDDERRAVLKQGIRFARIAQRYREAMLSSDEAAMALLERICLFRLGVDCETLAAIFTGPDAEKVSGKALAGLDGEQLQRKLDWLVHMRIVEQSESTESVRVAGVERSEPPVDAKSNETGGSLRSTPATRILYTIHPAVRDGFLGGISRDAALASHEAVRQGLEVSLGDAPGENPSDPVTLDLLEEIVHHTLQSGHVPEAFDIYWNRIGAYKNLLWRLGAYERGERICRAFAGGQSPETVGSVERSEDSPAPATHAHAAGTSPSFSLDAPYQDLPEDDRAKFINEWALYLDSLGRLAAAARCYELGSESAMRRDDWANASAGNRNLCNLWLLSGRLTGSSPQGAQASAAEALRLAELADDAKGRQNSHAFRAHARALRGEVPAALADFRAALDWQHKVDGDEDPPLYSLRGIRHARLLARLGRREEATRLTEANKEICLKHLGENDIVTPQCNLVLSELPGESLDRSARESLCASARDWAGRRGAKEVLCWSALVRARIELAKVAGTLRVPSARNVDNSDEGHNEVPNAADGTRSVPATFAAAQSSITEGLKIARDCGYGIHHIDLLLERARLRLLAGDGVAALDDVELALDVGVPANDKTGQVELLAANHEACGYAWAIPFGLQLRAEALLLRAAQTLGADSYVPAKIGDLPAHVARLIDQAKQHLHDALDRWHELRDPEPTEDNNFQLDGKEYNYRAAETHQLLVQLEGGMLTQYPLVLDDSPQEKKEDGMDIVTDPELRGDRLWFAIHRAIRAVREDKQILTTKKPEWDQGLNILEINQLAKEAHLSQRPVFEIGEIIQGGVLTDRLLKVHHPDIDDPVELCFWSRHGTTGFTDAKIDRLIAYLEAWQEKRQAQITGQKPASVPSPAGPPPQGPVDRPSMDICEIIFFAANPSGTGQLALDQEVREIESKIRATEYRDNLKLISKWAVRPDDLLQALNEHEARVIHFSGHGSPSEEIILVNDQGEPKPVSKAALNALLKTLGGNIGLVILNACFSKPQAETIVEHVDCAIGMNKAIGDKAAITFAASVYRAIGFGKSVQAAFDQGIAALLLEGIPEDNTPELLCKTGVDPNEVYLLRR